MATATGIAPVRAINGATVPSASGRRTLSAEEKATRAAARAAEKARAEAAEVARVAREKRVRTAYTVAALVAAVPVAIVVMIMSYCHITTLAMINGQSYNLAHMTPVSVDGLMIVAGIAAVGRTRMRLPKWAFITGAFYTLAANGLSVHPVHNVIIAIALAATPAVALLFVAEMILRLLLPESTRRTTRRTTRKPATKRK